MPAKSQTETEEKDSDELSKPEAPPNDTIDVLEEELDTAGGSKKRLEILSELDPGKALYFQGRPGDTY